MDEEVSTPVALAQLFVGLIVMGETGSRNDVNS
jgi:hypothetical protein